MIDGKHQILIVDDDDAVREYVSFALERKGYVTFCARDGKEALNLFARHKPDMIITDIVMPEAEGIEVIREIREKHPECVIIAMSGAANSNTYLSVARMLGAKKVLQKPFDKADVVAAVDSALKPESSGDNVQS
jgi:DNA-binding response OmpR family regulator